MFNYHLGKMRRSGVLDKIDLKWLGPPLPQEKLMAKFTVQLIPFNLSKSCNINFHFSLLFDATVQMKKDSTIKAYV